MEEILRRKVIDAAKDYYKKVYGNKKEKTYIPAAGKMLDADDLSAMIEASLDMWLTAGRFSDAFEPEFARFLGASFALATNSGSSANLLALSALTSHKLGDRALKKGDEVITVAAGFPTTVNPIFQLGLIPVFVDCELETCNIDIALFKKAITDKTKAVIIAHTLGNPFNIEEIAAICHQKGIWLVEDSCDALGAKYDGKYAGTIGDIGTFSFYPAHHMTMGEGGAVVTNNSMLYKILMSFRDWGRDCWCKPGTDNTCHKRFAMKLGNLPKGYDHKYTYSHIGYNLRITDWQAAIGLSQLKKLPCFLKKRKENAAFLITLLEDLKEFLAVPVVLDKAEPSWFGLLLLVRPNPLFTKQEMVEYLEQNGIGTRQLFAGNILRQPMIVDENVDVKIQDSSIINSKELNEQIYANLPNTEYIVNNAFWIGCFPALTENDLQKTSEVIHNFVRAKQK